MRLTKRVSDGRSYQGVGNRQFAVLGGRSAGVRVANLPRSAKGFRPVLLRRDPETPADIVTYGVLTPDQARPQARADLAEVETAGTDSMAERECQGETMLDRGKVTPTP